MDLKLAKKQKRKNYIGKQTNKTIGELPRKKRLLINWETARAGNKLQR